MIFTIGFWIIVGFAGLISLIAIVGLFSRDERKESLSILAALALVTAVVLGIWWALCSVVAMSNPHTVSTGYDTYKLRALGNSTQSKGSFFLGSGSINGKPTFQYVTDHGGYSTLDSIPASNVRIIEDGLQEMRRHYVVKNNTLWYDSPITVPTHTEFHIPADSVKESYNIDAGN